jgi:hypothetical protein
MTSLKERVLEAAARRPAPKRRGRHAQALLVAGAVLLAIGALAGALSVAGGTAHAAGRPQEAEYWMVAGTALLAVAATWLALPPAHSMLPPPRSQLLAVMAFPLVIGLWIARGHPEYADAFVRTGLRCFALTALTAPGPFLALLFLRRQPDPVHPGLSMGALAAAAGAWSAVMVELWCPLADPRHVVLGHVAPLVLLVLAGAAAGRRLLEIPQTRP